MSRELLGAYHQYHICSTLNSPTSLMMFISMPPAGVSQYYNIPFCYCLPLVDYYYLPDPTLTMCGRGTLIL
jgi:hypothetical protein